MIASPQAALGNRSPGAFFYSRKICLNRERCQSDEPERVFYRPGIGDKARKGPLIGHVESSVMKCNDPQDAKNPPRFAVYLVSQKNLPLQH